MFELDDDLPLDKILDIPSMIIVVGSVLQQDWMYCPHVVYMNVCMNLYINYEEYAIFVQYTY